MGVGRIHPSLLAAPSGEGSMRACTLCPPPDLAPAVIARNLLAGAAAGLATGASAEQAIMRAFELTAAALKACEVDCRFSGSTAILSILEHTPKGRQLTTGWVGDSRAVVGRSAAGRLVGGKANQMTSIPLTKDHKPEDPKERKRLADIRGIVRPSRVQHPLTGQLVDVGCMRVWDSSQIYGVAMSRSLGDMQVCRPPLAFLILWPILPKPA